MRRSHPVELGAELLEADGGAVLDPAMAGLEHDRAAREAGIGLQRHVERGMFQMDDVVRMRAQSGRLDLAGDQRGGLLSAGHEQIGVDLDLADHFADQPVDGLGEQQGERIGGLGPQHLQRLGQAGERVALGLILELGLAPPLGMAGGERLLLAPGPFLLGGQREDILVIVGVEAALGIARPEARARGG